MMDAKDEGREFHTELTNIIKRDLIRSLDIGNDFIEWETAESILIHCIKHAHTLMDWDIGIDVTNAVVAAKPNVDAVVKRMRADGDFEA